jgi:hypothetical protein
MNVETLFASLGGRRRAVGKRPEQPEKRRVVGLLMHRQVLFSRTFRSDRSRPLALLAVRRPVRLVHLSATSVAQQ